VLEKKRWWKLPKEPCGTAPASAERNYRGSESEATSLPGQVQHFVNSTLLSCCGWDSSIGQNRNVVRHFWKDILILQKAFKGLSF
jgi:hypothetical protein